MLNSLRSRITATMGLLIALVLLIAIIGVNAIVTLGRSADTQLATVVTGGELANGLVASATAEIRAAEQYLTRPDRALIEEFITEGDSAYAFQRRFRDLPGLTTEDRVRLNQVAASQAAAEVAYATAHALADLGRPEQARAAAEAAQAPGDTVVATVTALSAAQGERARTQAAALRAQAGRWRNALWLLFVAVLVVGIGAALTAIRAVDNPLKRLISAADRFGGGDLRPISLGSMPTELDRLGRAMDDMGARLRHVVSSVTTEANTITSSATDFSAMSEELAASSGEISTAMVRVASSAEQQRSGMDQAGALLDGLRAAAAANAQAATRVVQLGEQIRSLAAEHRGDVENAGTALLDVREVVRTSAGQVQELARQSEAITDFIDLIKQISSQTNLLALNAAIEAARAGEHGRGFAVVAEEVRRLADSSASAAESVTKTVEFIRRQVKEVSTTMELGSTKVAGIEGVAHAAARALDEIEKAVEEVHEAASAVSNEAQRNREIADELGTRTAQVAQSANEHAAASEEVTAAAEEQSASTEEMASAASELLQGAQRLGDAIRDFKV
ncbi:MAG TPA: HAMP domain-containing methyl-accepting chemotaxis protein [Gemmatimonadales bacterium]|jgi:methyl-accepting chemotaxis protein|nr:HAMP domain-containing methyl-accepting chemotaxis protein [Gemmatimonadales bacterium]